MPIFLLPIIATVAEAALFIYIIFKVLSKIYRDISDNK